VAVVPAQDRLGGHVRDLLALAATGLIDAGDNPVAYISPDVPSLDFLGSGPTPCAASMLAVQVISVAREPTTPTSRLDAEQAHRYGWLSMASVTFTYARCIHGLSSSGRPPGPDVQTDDALLVIRYGWAIWNAINWGVRHGLALERCRQFNMGSLVPITAAGGGAAGYTLTVGFQVDGYDVFESPAARHLVGISDTSPANA
jgi:hypothetical protein